MVGTIALTLERFPLRGLPLHDLSDHLLKQLGDLFRGIRIDMVSNLRMLCPAKHRRFLHLLHRHGHPPKPGLPHGNLPQETHSLCALTIVFSERLGKSDGAQTHELRKRLSAAASIPTQMKGSHLPGMARVWARICLGQPIFLPQDCDEFGKRREALGRGQMQRWSNESGRTCAHPPGV